MQLFFAIAVHFGPTLLVPKLGAYSNPK